MDYTVEEKTPYECLAAAEIYFIRRWPYRGTVNRTDTYTIFSENQGCFAMFFLGRPKGVQIFALPGNGATRLTVDAGRHKYRQTVNTYLISELGAKPVQ